MTKIKKHNLKSKRGNKIGLPPGASVYVGVDRQGPAVIDLISYSIDDVKVNNDFKLINLHSLDKNKIHWLNVEGVHDVNIVSTICTYFKIHALTEEDILNTIGRPKCEIYESYIYSGLKMIKSQKDILNIEEEQVGLVLTDNFVISFQEVEGDVFEPIRARLQNPESRVRRKKADYLFFLLHDIIVDNYLLTTDYIEDANDALELNLLKSQNETILNQIQSLKSELFFLKRNITPVRESIAKILRSDAPMIEKENLKYFNDLFDHLNSSVEAIDAQTEVVVSHRELYMSMMNINMNNVMKVLTIISSIFIPLTFIVGVYGMNFDYMPELRMKNGYFIILGVMAFMSFLMLIYFKIKKWI